MVNPLRRDGRPGNLAMAAVALALSGTATLVLGLDGRSGPPQPATTPTAAVVSEPTASSTQAPAPAPSAAQPAPTELSPVLPVSEPVALDIPSIGVHSTELVPLTVGPDGALPAPTGFAQVGWYAGGPTPGQFGPAVIAGHVDGPTGPAVFYRLGQLTKGAQVTVTRKDGSVATFTIDDVASYAKADFPTSLVYGNTTNRAEIRLITCGGTFDRGTGHYVDNIIAFGHLIG